MSAGLLFASSFNSAKSEPALLHLRCHLHAGERARRTPAAQYIYRVAERGDRGRTASFLERRGEIPRGYSAVGIDARELHRGQASAAVAAAQDIYMVFHCERRGDETRRVHDRFLNLPR